MIVLLAKVWAVFAIVFVSAVTIASICGWDPDRVSTERTAFMKFSRDDWKWTLGLFAAVVVGLAALGSSLVDYGIPATWLPYIRLAALVVGLISGKLATSPLPGKDDPMKVDPSKLAVFLPLLLVGSLYLPACAHPAPTPIAAVADTVTRLEQTMDVAVKAADTANHTVNPATGMPLLSDAQDVAVALAGDKVGRLGLDLSQALTALSAAKAAGSDPAALQMAARQVINAITQALADIGRTVPPGLVQQIDTAVAAAFGFVAQIQIAHGL